MRYISRKKTASVVQENMAMLGYDTIEEFLEKIQSGYFDFEEYLQGWKWDNRTLTLSKVRGSECSIVFDKRRGLHLWIYGGAVDLDVYPNDLNQIFIDGGRIRIFIKPQFQIRLG